MMEEIEKKKKELIDKIEEFSNSLQLVILDDEYSTTYRDLLFKTRIEMLKIQKMLVEI